MLISLRSRWIFGMDCYIQTPNGTQREKIRCKSEQARPCDPCVCKICFPPCHMADHAPHVFLFTYTTLYLTRCNSMPGSTLQDFASTIRYHIGLASFVIGSSGALIVSFVMLPCSWPSHLPDNGAPRFEEGAEGPEQTSGTYSVT